MADTLHSTWRAAEAPPPPAPHTHETIGRLDPQVDTGHWKMGAVAVSVEGNLVKGKK